MTSPARKEAQTEAREPTEAQMEAARAVRDHLCLSSECKFDKGCGCLEALSQAIATAHREGMKRAAEIAQRQARFHLEASAMSLPVEPSPIIAKDRARIANCIADAILSEANPEKPGSSSNPATAAPGANPSQALGAPVEPGAAGANATAASFSGRE